MLLPVAIIVLLVSAAAALGDPTMPKAPPSVQFEPPVVVHQSFNGQHAWFSGLVQVPLAAGSTTTDDLPTTVLLASMSLGGDGTPCPPPGKPPQNCSRTQYSLDGGRSWRIFRNWDHASDAVVVGTNGTFLTLPYSLQHTAGTRNRSAWSFSGVARVAADSSGQAAEWAWAGSHNLSWSLPPSAPAGAALPERVVRSGSVVHNNNNNNNNNNATLLTTLYGHGSGAYRNWTSHSMVLFVESTDGGRHWTVVGNITWVPAYGPHADGPGEPDTALLPDGQLLCVFRSDSQQTYYRSLSRDRGRSWSQPQPLQLAWSVKPRLRVLPGGTLVLTGGRPGLFLWTSSDLGQTWVQHNLAAVHNQLVAHTPLANLSYVPAVVDVAGPATPRADPPQTSSYTGLAVLNSTTLVITYDRLANGWAGPPGPYGPCDTLFSMRIHIASGSESGSGSVSAFPVSPLASSNTPSTPHTTTSDLYVSAKHGSDGFPGTLALPFRTLARAVEARGKLPPQPTVTIHLRAGRYEIDATVELGATHSNTVLTRYAPDAPAEALISGARSLGPWRESAWKPSAGATVWAAALPSSSSSGGGGGVGDGGVGVGGVGDGASTALPTQLFKGEGGAVRAIRSRLPHANYSNSNARGLGANSTFVYKSPLRPCAGSTCPDVNKLGLVYANGDVPANMYNPTGADVLVFHAWTARWSPVGQVVPSNNTLLFAVPAEEPLGNFPAPSGSRYVLENVREGLEPGAFYVDAAEKLVLYMPAPGDPARTDFQAYLPAVSTLLRISSSASNIVLSNLALAHTTTGDRYSLYFAPEGGLEITEAAQVTIDSCVFRQMGGSGVLVSSSVAGLHIESSLVEDVGGDGISMQSPGQYTRDVLINNTIVRDTGKIFLCQPAGIRLRGNSSIVASNNLVQDGPYGGILVGWQTGHPVSRFPAPPASEPIFTVERNLVDGFGLGILNDFGGIYLSSNNNTCFDIGTCALPSLVRQNHVRNGRHFQYGSEGIYMDEQVGSQRLEQNILENIGDSGIYFHCGTSHVGISNILYSCGQQNTGGAGAYLKSCNKGGNPTWPNLPHGFVWNATITYITGNSPQENFVKDTDYRDTAFASNVYFTPDPALALTFPGGLNFSAWQATGQDRASLFGKDPLFTNAAAGDFSLRPDSPAPALGFEAFDHSLIGPHNNPWQERL